MIEIYVDDDDINKLLEKVKVDRQLMEQIGIQMETSTIEKINNLKEPPNSPLTILNKKGDKPLKDTGHLISSITYIAEDRRVIIGTDRGYAHIQQFGATITPKNAEKLAIQFGWKMRREVKKYGSIKGVLEAYKKQGYKVWFTEKAIVGKKGRGKAKVLFIRKSKVKIPKRPFLYLSDEDKEEITQIVKEKIQK